MNIAAAVESVKSAAPSRDTLKDAAVLTAQVAAGTVAVGVLYGVATAVGVKVYSYLMT